MFVDQGKGCIEFLVCGELVDLVVLCVEFFSVVQELNVDIVFQQDSVFCCNCWLVVFDMDLMLIEVEVIDELVKVVGVGEKVVVIIEWVMCGELDFCVSFKECLVLLQGLLEDVLEEIGVLLCLIEGVEILFVEFKCLGYKIVILFGGFIYFVC